VFILLTQHCNHRLSILSRHKASRNRKRESARCTLVNALYDTAFSSAPHRQNDCTCSPALR